MKDLTVIIPINILDSEEKINMLNTAIKSVDSSNIVIVGHKEAIECISEVITMTDNITLLTNTSRTKNYASNVYFATKNINTQK